jgi:hypothetical protein
MTNSFSTVAVPPPLAEHFVSMGWLLVHDTPAVAHVAPPATFSNGPPLQKENANPMGGAGCREVA